MNVFDSEFPSFELLKWNVIDLHTIHSVNIHDALVHVPRGRNTFLIKKLLVGIENENTQFEEWSMSFCILLEHTHTLWAVVLKWSPSKQLMKYEAAIYSILFFYFVAIKLHPEWNMDLIIRFLL